MIIGVRHFFHDIECIISQHGLFFNLCIIKFGIINLYDVNRGRLSEVPLVHLIKRWSNVVEFMFLGSGIFTIVTLTDLLHLFNVSI